MIITAGIYKGRKILVPDESITRPTLSKVRMGVFNTLFSILGEFEGKSFLDVFGGSGVMGLEALSRGFESVRVFEKNPKAAEIIKKNYASLGIKPDLILGDSRKLLSKFPEKYDVAYVDPPYEAELYEEILPLISADIIIAEHSKVFEFKGLELIKQKSYGGKFISYLQNKTLL